MRIFARVYDELMDNVPYEEWADFLQTKLEGYGITDGLMLDLACRHRKAYDSHGAAGLRHDRRGFLGGYAPDRQGERPAEKVEELPVSAAGYERI